MLLNKRDNGNYYGKTDGGRQISLYQVKDDYGYVQPNVWKWLLADLQRQYLKVFSELSFDTHNEAAADLQAYINKKYNIEFTILLPEDMEVEDNTVSDVKDLMGNTLTDDERITL